MQSVCAPGYALTVRGLKIAPVAATCHGRATVVAKCMQVSWMIYMIQSFKVEYTQKIDENATYLVLQRMPLSATAKNVKFFERTICTDCKF